MFSRPVQEQYIPSPPITTNTPPVDPGITSFAELLMVSTVFIIPPFIKIYVDGASGKQQTYILAADGSGARPNDFNAVNNIKSWYKAGT